MGSESSDKDCRQYFVDTLADGAAASCVEDGVNIVCDDNADPDYRKVLLNLTEHGKSYVLQMKDEKNGLPISVKYEAENVLFNDAEQKCVTGRKEISSSPSCPRKGNPIKSVSQNADKKRGKPFILKCSRQKTHQNTAKLSQGFTCREKSRIDEDYKRFFSCLRKCGDSMVFEEGNISILYEEIYESLSPSEDSSTVSCENQLLIRDESPPQHSDDSWDDSVPFEEGLMSVLSNPYNEAEHEALLAEISVCKTVKQEKHLRTRSVLYDTARRGKSYLDYFPDFAKELKVADPIKSLTLLRGFFFWLQNLTKEGAFKPWETPQDYFAIIPANSEVFHSDYEVPHPIQISVPEKF